MPEISCPLPKPITHEAARAVYSQVRKDLKGLSDSAYRREAARRMDVDYDTYLKAWKKPALKQPVEVPKVHTPPPTKPVTPRPPAPDLQKPPAPADRPNLPTHKPVDVLKPNPVEPDKVQLLDHATARRTFNQVKKLKPNLTDAQARRMAAELLDTDYKSYLTAWKKPTQSRTRDLQAAPDYPKPPPHVLTPKERSEFRKIDDLVPGEAQELDPVTVVNPLFRKGKLEWRNNCTSCTSSWEMRQRGYDVVALPMKQGRYLWDVYEDWGIGHENMIMRSDVRKRMKFRADTMPVPTDYGFAIAQLRMMPEGARGFMNVNWNSGGAHIFNWEIRRGELRLVDAQAHHVKDINGLAKRIDQSFVFAARVDELPTPMRSRLEKWTTERERAPEHLQIARSTGRPE